MRLFSALTPPPAVREHLRSALNDALLPTDDGRWWVPVENWHTTLVFYGNVTVDDAERLRTRLSKVATRSAPLRLRLEGAGGFGRTVGWIGVTGDLTPLTQLVENLKDPRIEHRDRPYQPHITVSRHASDAAVAATLRALQTYRGPDWKMQEITLFVSEPGRKIGEYSRYTALLTVPLLGLSDTGSQRIR